VSHELRTPLTAIIASLEMLDEVLSDASSDRTSRPSSTHVPSSWSRDLLDVPTPPAPGAEVPFAGGDAARLMSAMTRNTGLLAARIDELLSSQPVDEPLLPVPTDVSALVGAALGKHEFALVRAKVSLEQRVDHGLVTTLDPARFEQIVDNLVSNSVKYTASGGTVVVELRTTDEHLVLSVADSGVGMTPDEQRQAFDRFFRAPRARAQAVQGFGIGLSLVKSLVERHDGDIDLRSAPGRGTTVTVTLPLVPARA
jgi:signal transduction histidine kinase